MKVNELRLIFLPIHPGNLEPEKIIAQWERIIPPISSAIPNEMVLRRKGTLWL